VEQKVEVEEVVVGDCLVLSNTSSS
jgi:hypothetical protein